MKSDSGKVLARSQQVPCSGNAARGPPAGAGPGQSSTTRVCQLANMTFAELSALTQRHNKQFGLIDDVLAPVMRGVLDAATARPPAVHPFSIGGGIRKDEYRAAWKSITKRHAVPPLAPIGVAAAASGAAAAPANSSLVAGAAATQRTSTMTSAHATPVMAPGPSREDIYGMTELPAAQLQFMSALAGWLGVGPIDLPLLAPDAPPVPLKQLLMEVLDAGGSTTICSRSSKGGDARPVLSWSDLAGKLLWDEDLADVLKQVYDAYLLPLERRLPTGIRSRRVEVWMQEDARRRASLASEGVTATAEQVDARLSAARTALQALEHVHTSQRQQPQPQSGPPIFPTTDDEEAEPVAKLAASAPETVAIAISESSPLPDTELLCAIRRAAVGAGGLLPASPVTAGKRSRSTSRSRRREKSSGRVRSKSGAKEGLALSAECGAGGRTSVSGANVGSPMCAGNDGRTQTSEAADAKVVATLALVTSLRELRAGPPGYTAHKPDLQANFLSRWQAQHEAKLAEEDEAAAAIAEAVSVPAGADVFAATAAAAAVAAASDAARLVAAAATAASSGAGAHGGDGGTAVVHSPVDDNRGKRPRLSEAGAGPTAAALQLPPLWDHPRRRSPEGSLSPRAVPQLQQPAQGNLTKDKEQSEHAPPQPMLAGQEAQDGTTPRMTQQPQSNTHNSKTGQLLHCPPPHPPPQVSSKTHQAPYSMARTAACVPQPSSVGHQSEAALSLVGAQSGQNGCTSLQNLPPSQQHAAVFLRQSPPLQLAHHRAWDATGAGSSATHLNGGGSQTHSGSGSMSFQSPAAFVLDLDWAKDK